MHILCALVLFGVVRRTLAGAGIPAPCARSAGGIALACALLWMVHPLQTECVNYLSQRTESIMGLCYLLTLYCAIRAAGPDRRAWWNRAAILACATGMASKEVMCTAR